MTKRLFVALRLPKADAEAFRALGQTVVGATEGRLVAVGKMHVTLYFLGDVQDEDVADLKGRLASVATLAPPLLLEFDRVTFAPPGRVPTMLWAVYRDQGGYAQLVRDVAKAVSDVGRRPKDHEQSVAHVTIARFPRGVPAAVLREPLARLSVSPLVADRIILFESRINDGSSPYVELASFPLQGTL